MLHILMCCVCFPLMDLSSSRRPGSSREPFRAERRSGEAAQTASGRAFGRGAGNRGTLPLGWRARRHLPSVRRPRLRVRGPEAAERHVSEDAHNPHRWRSRGASRACRRFVADASAAADASRTGHRPCTVSSFSLILRGVVRSGAQCIARSSGSHDRTPAVSILSLPITPSERELRRQRHL